MDLGELTAGNKPCLDKHDGAKNWSGVGSVKLYSAIF